MVAWNSHIIILGWCEYFLMAIPFIKIYFVVLWQRLFRSAASLGFAVFQQGLQFPHDLRLFEI
jgi:hypothetical protein